MFTRKYNVYFPHSLPLLHIQLKLDNGAAGTTGQLSTTNIKDGKSSISICIVYCDCMM